MKYLLLGMGKIRKNGLEAERKRKGHLYICSLSELDLKFDSIITELRPRTISCLCTVYGELQNPP